MFMKQIAKDYGENGEYCDRCTRPKPKGEVMPDGTPKSNSREEYEKTLAYAKEHDYRAMYNSMAEEGYDPTVNWEELRH